MRVLHYTQEFVPPTQTFVHDQVELGRAEGHDIRICTRRKTLEKGPLVEDITITGNLNFIKPGILRYLYAAPGLHYLLPGVDGWRTVLKDFRPDIIHCHFAWSLVDILPVLQWLRYPCPILVSLHGTDVTVYPRRVKTLGKLIMTHPYPLHFTVPSRFLGAQARRALPISEDAITWLPNMVNETFMFRRENAFRHGDQLKIINIGRLVSVKGQRYLLEAFAKFVHEHYENARLILLGSGRDLRAIKKIIRQHDLQSRVEIIPAMPHDQIPELLAGCHIYVQPSVYDPVTRQSEAFGLAVVEAIAAGLPVIVTDTGGLQETVLSGHPDSAIVVSEKDPRALCQAMRRILENAVWQDPGYREKVMAAYHPDAFARTLAKIYRLLLNQSK